MGKAKKRLTNKEKAERARLKKQMQEKGILPPDKKRLNRRKFAKEVQRDWESNRPHAGYLSIACQWMMPSPKGQVTPETVGVLKAMKIAMEIQCFEQELAMKGEHTYSVMDLYEQVVKPVMDL